MAPSGEPLGPAGPLACRLRLNYRPPKLVYSWPYA